MLAWLVELQICCLPAFAGGWWQRSQQREKGHLPALPPVTAGYVWGGLNNGIMASDLALKPDKSIPSHVTGTFLCLCWSFELVFANN